MKAKKKNDFEEVLIDDLLNSEELGEDASLSPVENTNSKGSVKSKDIKESKLKLPDSGDEIVIIDDKTTPLKSVKANNNVRPQVSPDETAMNPNDKTVQLSDSKLYLGMSNQSVGGRSAMSFDRSVKTSVGGKVAMRPGVSALGGSSEAALIQSENLRVAQQKIFELEQELDRMRRDNEQLAAAAETIKKRADNLAGQSASSSEKLQDLKEQYKSEKEILETTLKERDIELNELKIKNEEFESRLSSNLQKIRMRERELENRLELIKMESTAVVRSKDELILDLKRQTDQLNHEIDNYRTKGQETSRVLEEKQDALKRTVKALRLALNMLEGSVDATEPFKKAK